MGHVTRYFEEVKQVVEALDLDAIERVADALSTLRERGGRLFILGVGGSAGNAGHAVNDFRKLCGIESYAPTDNVSELTARTNDEGWDTVFSAWLATSKASDRDAVLIFSVGGGNAEKNVSTNLVCALDEAKTRGMTILGIVGRDGGHAAKVGNEVVIVPTVEATHVTPHAEAFQAVIWHCLVSHPKLQIVATKW